jgi:hypothetical protein
MVLAKVLYFEETTEFNAITAKCHENVDAWITLKPGRKAVRGWLVQSDFGGGAYLLASHSIGFENGKLWDITPPDVPPGQIINLREPRVFVRHDGTVESFEKYREPEWVQFQYPPLSLPIADIGWPPEPD